MHISISENRKLEQGDFKLKKRNEVFINERALNRWTFALARHLQTIITSTLEDIELKKADCEDGHLENGITKEDYTVAVKEAEKYYENFDDEILKKHCLEKSYHDFRFLVSLNFKKLRFFDDDLLATVTF